MKEFFPVSVVIPTFNRSSFLQNAVRSALDQTTPPFEVIVVDHCSTDETADVVASFGKAVIGVRLEDSGRGGPAVPRNAGIRRSRGDWVAFLDDDDAWEPEKLERQLDEAQRGDQIVLVSTDASVVDSSGRAGGSSYLSHVAAGPGDVFARLIKDNVVITSSVLVRRAALLDTEAFDERAALHTVEDYHLWLRLAVRGEFRHIDEALVRYRRDAKPHSLRALRRALRQRRTVLRLALEDAEVAKRANEVRMGIARDYARTAISLIRNPA